MPEHLREKIREDAQFQVAQNYRLSGLGRHAPDGDVGLAKHSLSALSVQLGGKLYLTGNQPCGTDATAFAMLAGLFTPFFESDMRQMALQFSNLVDYVDRMMDLFYPEHDRLLQEQAA